MKKRKLEKKLKKANEEIKRWRNSRGAFDDGLCDLFSILIQSGYNPKIQVFESGTKEDYREAVRVVVDGVKELLEKKPCQP